MTTKSRFMVFPPLNRCLCLGSFPLRRLLGSLGSETWGAQLVYVGGERGYQLRNRGSQAPLELNWLVKTVVSPLAADGSVLGPVSDISREFDVLSPAGYVGSWGGPFPSAGTFQVRIEFAEKDGTMLGSYSEFVQAVPWTLHARLKLSETQAEPGGNLKVRLENVGTREISYG